MNKLLKEAMDSLALVGIYSKDADSLEERAKKKLAEGGRIQVIAPNGDRCSVVRAGENMVQSWSEKRHQWESFPLSKCKILSVDAEPSSKKLPAGITMTLEGYYYYKGKGPYTSIEKALAGGTPNVHVIGDNKTKDADPDLKYREFIKKYGYPKTKEQAKALIEKAKKEGIDPDYIKGMERGLNTWDAEPKSQRVTLELEEGGEKAHQEAIKKEKELKRKHKEVKLVNVSPTFKYWEWEVKDADTVSEYNAEIQRLTKKAEQLRKAGQGKSAMEIEKQIEKLGKEAHEYSKDNDATENGAIKQFGQSKETEVMPLEKKPVLAQDAPDQKELQRLNNLHVYEKLKEIVEENMKRYKPDHPEYKRLAGLSKKYEDEIKKYSRDEEPVYTFGGQFKKLDELEKEKLEVEGKLQELYDIRDGLLSGAKNTNSPKFNPIKQNIQNHENKLKEIEKDINKIKSGGKMTKDEKTYQNGEHVKVKNHGTGEEIDLKVLRDNKDGTLEVKAPTGAVITVKKTWIVDSASTALDECMEVLKLSGIV